MDYITGLIIKATGGFYYVQSGGAAVECRARGLFRKQGISPLVGDIVKVEPTGEGTGYVVDILPRKNVLVRPPLANVDTLVIVSSVSDPAPNPLIIDKMLAIAAHNGIRPLLIITKSDLGGAAILEDIYHTVGIGVFTVSDKDEEQLASVRAALAHGLSVFSGNSGVGKSSLLNRIDARLTIETGETSRKLGRGKHTTRHVELYPIGSDGFIADTPGFSAVEMTRCEIILKDELEDCFIEFAPYLGKCQFTGCSHTKEKGCAVLSALAIGALSTSRHASYCAMYEDARHIKEWETKDTPSTKERSTF